MPAETTYRYVQFHDAPGGSAATRYLEWWPGLQLSALVGRLTLHERGERGDTWGPPRQIGTFSLDHAREIAREHGCGHEENIQ